ncbi:L-lactate dehydrogenase [Staphylococcus kloosii]|jgi:L-lactate dehydrogenase|uniref:L-lactate dehydrogenase n=1 Tax=Staphylococcus kloosii TaxID=29384 RepID=UPI0018A05C7F|nr:L-lactate dehydrogenase [Staphylococcus kloosii]MBF7024536.1 L-lactate dehydrogenase [Staphylococcus kloosii]
MEYTKSNKVVLIGDGAVGSSYAYTLVTQGIVDELAIIDVNKERVAGDVKDLAHASALSAKNTNIKVGTYEDCADADIIVITAGVNQKPHETRLDLVTKNTEIYKEIIANIMAYKFSGIFIIATNPVDIMSYVTKKLSGFPKEKVIGSGTVLDSARFKHELSLLTGIAPANIDAQIIGEHGDSELPVWTNVQIAGQSLNNFRTQYTISENDLNQAFINTKEAAYHIIKAKGATCYGIAMALTEITVAILSNQNKVLTVSSYLENNYGYNDVYIGVPTLINRNGAMKVYEVVLNSIEKEQFKDSILILKDTQKKLSNYFIA